MADYYPLLARALDALPDRSPALRKAVYDRARNALIGQLRSLDPPLSEDDIDLERRALDKAIARLEVDHGGVPAPANDVPPPVTPAPVETPTATAAIAPTPPPAVPEIPEPSPPEPNSAPSAAASAPPSLPQASAPSFAASPEPEPREASVAFSSRKPRPAPSQAPEAASTPDARPEPPVASEPAVGADADPAASSEPGNGRQRPRIAVVPPRAGRSKILRNAFVGIVLATVIGLIAVAAFLLRDRPQALRATGPETADPQQPDGEAKYGDRVSGEAAQAERAAPRQDGSAQRQSGPAPARGAAAPAQPGVAVAQRAVLLEEAAGGENAPPNSSTGRVTWRLDTVNGEQGQPLQNVVVATVTFPDPGLTLVMTIQRNLDATLPASHTVNLAFSGSGPDAATRSVQDVGLLQAKDEESARGSPVSGLPVRVRENLFLIGLSSLRNDVDRNTDLLLHRNWFDIAVRYASGKRAVLTFEKGNSGAQVLQSAFDAWQ